MYRHQRQFSDQQNQICNFLLKVIYFNLANLPSFYWKLFQHTHVKYAPLFWNRHFRRRHNYASNQRWV